MPADGSAAQPDRGEIDQIIQAEIGERVRAAADYDRGGQPGPAQRLRAEADVLRRLAAGDQDRRA